MTQIKPHMPHPAFAREVERSGADHRGREDFFDHLRDVRDQRGRPDKDVHSDGKRPQQAGAGADTPANQPQVPGDTRGDATKDGLVTITVNRLRDPPQMLAAQPAAIRGTEVGKGARLFEQHWFANGYLSFLAEADQVHASGGNARAGAVQGEHLAIGMNLAGATPASPASRADATCMDDATWPVALEAPVDTESRLPRTIDRLARTLGPLLAADQPWPERLLRLSHQPGGRATLWVRDYALTQQAIEPLVAHLRRLARQEGVALERVVVNGTTVWHSESFKGEA